MDTLYNRWKAISFILMGVSAGLIVVLIWTLTSKKPGFLSRDLAPVFEYNQKTYVAFPHPIVHLTVITTKDCPKDLSICNTQSVFTEIQRNVTYGLLVRELKEEDEEAQKLISSLSLRYLPAYLFDKDLSIVPTFTNLQTRSDVPYFTDIGRYYLLNYLPRTNPGKILDSGPGETSANQPGSELDKTQPKSDASETTESEPPPEPNLK